MEDYVKCELIGGGSRKTLKHFFPNVFIVAVHNTYQYMLCIVAIVKTVLMYTMLSTTKQSEHIISSNVDCTHVGSAIASFEDMVTLHRGTLQQIF